MSDTAFDLIKCVKFEENCKESVVFFFFFFLLKQVLYQL